MDNTYLLLAAYRAQITCMNRIIRNRNATIRRLRAQLAGTPQTNPATVDGMMREMLKIMAEIKATARLSLKCDQANLSAQGVPPIYIPNDDVPVDVRIIA